MAAAASAPGPAQFQLTRVTSRAGWFVDIIQFHMANGDVDTVGSHGGSPLPDFELASGEYIVEARIKDDYQYCGLGIELVSSTGRISRIWGSQYSKRSVPVRTYRASPGSQIVGLRRARGRYAGVKEAPIPNASGSDGKEAKGPGSARPSLRVEAVSGRAGWYVDMISFHLSTGEVNTVGGHGGSKIPDLKLQDKEYVAEVKVKDYHDFCGLGIEVFTTTGRSQRFWGEQYHNQNRPVISFKADRGNQIIGLKRRGTRYVGIIQAPISGPVSVDPALSPSAIFKAFEARIQQIVSAGDRKEEKRDRVEKPILRREGSEKAMDDWEAKFKSIEDVPEVYKRAANRICLKWEWVTHTQTLTILNFLGRGFGSTVQHGPTQSQDLKAMLLDHQMFDRTVKQLIAKAYGVDPHQAASQRCLMTGANVLAVLQSSFGRMGWRQPYFHMALWHLMHECKPDELTAKLGGFIDSASKCLSAQRLAFQMLIKHAHLVACGLKNKNSEGSARAEGRGMGGNDPESELRALRTECERVFRAYIDYHKHRAYCSAFLEPVRCYYKAVGNHTMLNDAEVHGVNWYLAGTMAAIGMRFPLVPFLGDQCCKGFAEHWHAKGSDRMWSEYKKSENFGKPFEGIRSIRSMARREMGRAAENSMGGGRLGSAKRFGETIARDPNSRTGRKWAEYMERLCYFFSAEFFCEKAISMLMQEGVDFGATGFRKVLEKLYEHYKIHEKEDKESDLLGFIYDDEKNAYDTARVNNLLHFAGITKSKIPVAPKKSLTDRGKQNKPATDVKVAYKPRVRANPELMRIVTPMVREGASQQTIFEACRAKLQGNGRAWGNMAIFDAVRQARSEL
eukprot:CAMPEP_0114492272 /NCGR_PEP_ID=MMETSP0109-20121206/3463_1 /TAXON_ID=29199 /ORGANISM="Chlorarachnion reptans, Strain CCCM449" /LENGTH=846 /DNA_ID=CAMNT_0001669097 /DNA_START=9 /DNA_END=2549 /DNA_ORIENTATION=-